jgi:glycosyltransferase involved in cell wall biosynthesis
MADLKHIAIISSHLNLAGGYERIVPYTANLFAEKGIQTTLVILGDTAKSFYPIDKKVRVIQKNADFGITQKGNIISRKIKMLRDLITLREVLKELDAGTVICTEYPFAVSAILCGGKKYATIVSWEHTHFNANIKNTFWTKLFRRTYPKLDAIVCLNKDEKELFKPLNKKVTVIPNFVIPVDAISTLRSKVILTIARLTAVKGIIHLLQTAKLVLQQHREWQWKIIGSGEMKEDVLHFIEKENLQKRLLLQEPVSHNIQLEYQNASLYVMTSLNECFPMVLLEALSNGLPCISFDCDTGPRHIITNNQDGLLVEKENTEKLAAAISSLINDEEKRKMMSKNAVQSSQRFSPDAVYKQWEEKIFTL